jgi:inosine/xanthosine triphosphate pyrophosphatase family protein
MSSFDKTRVLPGGSRRSLNRLSHRSQALRGLMDYLAKR